MDKELCQFSIVCKKELESNFEAIVQVIQRSPRVTEECVAKVALIWLASFDLMNQFDTLCVEKSGPYTDTKTMANLKCHFFNYLRAENALETVNNLVTHDDFCGWLGQISNFPQYYSDSELMTKMLAMAEAISESTGLAVQSKAFFKQYSSNLHHETVRYYMNNAPASNYSLEGCKRHLTEVLNTTSFKLSDNNLIEYLTYFQMSIMIFALFTNLLELMAFSLVSMVLLDSWNDTISKSQSNLERMNSEALQTTLYKGDQIPEALCAAILHNRQAVSKIKSHFAVATPVAQAEIVPASPTKRERPTSGMPNEATAQAIRINL